MEKEFIEKMQAKLIEQRDLIQNRMSAQHAEFKKIVESSTPGDEVDIASDVIDGQLLESRGALDSNTLQMINNALNRIKQGQYGICLVCKKEIPQDRLESVPYAFMCVNCKSKDERRNR